jgi:hypothetical protein
LGREAAKLCEDACKTLRGPMGFTIMRIYQTLAVEFQTA